MTYEIRTFAADEIRLEDGDKAPVIHASIKFETLSLPLGYWTKFREKIAEGAFDGTLDDESRDVLAFWNHVTAMPLGRRSRQTLKLSKTSTLLKAEIHPGDTTWGQDAVKSIQRGDVEGMSFGFRVLAEGEKWSEDKDRNLIRTVTNAELIEVSPTPMPAYPSSSASVRSENGGIHELTEKEMEEFLAARRSELHQDTGAGAEMAARIAAQVADRQRRERLQRQLVRR